MPVFANACTPLPAWHVFSWGHSPPACCSSPSPVTVPCPHTPGCPLAPSAPLLPCIPQHLHQPLPGTAPVLPLCHGVPGVGLDPPCPPSPRGCRDQQARHRADGSLPPASTCSRGQRVLPTVLGRAGGCGVPVDGWGASLCVCVHVHTWGSMGMGTHVHICGSCLSPPPCCGGACGVSAGRPHPGTLSSILPGLE